MIAPFRISFSPLSASVALVLLYISDVARTCIKTAFLRGKSFILLVSCKVNVALSARKVAHICF